MKPCLSYILLLVATSCSAAPLPKEAISDPGQMLFNGYVREDISCYRCHGGDGSGTWKGADLVGLGQREGLDEIEGAIKAGPWIMPAYADKLNERELGQLSSWIASLE